jgi:hypothetical protein
MAPAARAGGARQQDEKCAPSEVYTTGGTRAQPGRLDQDDERVAGAQMIECAG